MSTRSKGAKTTKNGRVFVTCTLSPEGYRKMRELIDAIGATSQGQVIEQSIHRWYSEEPLIQKATKVVEQQPPTSPLTSVLKNRSKAKKCQDKKIDCGKELENG